MFINFPLIFLAFLLEMLNTHSVDTKGKAGMSYIFYYYPNLLKSINKLA